MRFGKLYWRISDKYAKESEIGKRKKIKKKEQRLKLRIQEIVGGKFLSNMILELVSTKKEAQQRKGCVCVCVCATKSPLRQGQH